MHLTDAPDRALPGPGPIRLGRVPGSPNGRAGRRPALGIACMTAAFALTACGSKSSSTTAPAGTASGSSSPVSSASTTSVTTTPKATTPIEPGEVIISDYEFTPDPISVKVGDTVTWTNRDEVDHAIRSVPTAPMAFDLGRQGTGAVVTVTFPKPGTYPYFCNLHNYMKGTVVVK